MNSIKVITKIVPKELYLGEIINYSHNFNKIAKKQNGYIKSKTFVHNFNTIYTISDWETEKDWDKWSKNMIKEKNYNYYKNLLLDTNNTILYETNFNDTFLL